MMQPFEIHTGIAVALIAAADALQLIRGSRGARGLQDADRAGEVTRVKPAHELAHTLPGDGGGVE